MNITDLVTKYEANREAYLKANYNETQLRTDFLDPFFTLLGWDITNKKGKSTNEREVLVEEALKVDANSNTKKPDYTFRLFSERKFFLEAKKPNVKIEKDDAPAKQIRRYGFTAKLKISVLTNFEYLAIYDCSQKVEKNDTVTKSKVKLYHYSEYEEAFEEIKQQLSYETVYNGQFDEVWSNMDSQLKLSSVDSLFLTQINEWRLLLGNEIYSHKPGIIEEELNDIVQRYINSIIFLRVCEDRNIETYKTLLSYADKEDFNAFINKFKEADKNYNAGLFNHPLIEEIISNNSSAFWTIIKQLYFPESSYSFAVFSSDILGNIYEIFLGEQLKIENKNILLKKKPEHVDRDIVTTPTHIVQDILRQTVTEFCKEKTDKEILNATFADIACGSGVFLLETYQLLHDILVDYYLANNKAILIQTGIDSYKLPFKIKTQILTQCIWGVDKDYNAVEACKFGLLLKLLEGEDNASISKPVLPNMDENIAFGNSLLNSEMVSEEHQIIVNPFDYSDKKFDVIVGNPPYLATEHIKEFTPLEYPLYKKEYPSAYKQFDKYFLFIERATQLLKPNGYLGYIVPSKFMKVGAGKKLREYLATNQLVSQIISFGANQIFQDKTTYTCLLIIQNKKNENFIYTEIANFNDWKIRNTEGLISDTIQVNKLSHELWSIVPPYLKDVFRKILEQSKNLEDVIGKNYINNGIQTSANDVLVFKSLKEKDDLIFFKKNDKLYKIEKSIVKPYYETVRTKNEVKLNTYRILKPNSYVIFPYKFTDGTVKFIDLDDLKENYPEAHKYLNDVKIKHRLIYQKNSTKLRSVMPKPKTENEWYRFGRSQYLELGAINEKILIGVMSTGEKYPIDFSKTLHTAGGTAGYCSIYLPSDSKYSIYYIQAILNSRYLEWIINLRGEVFRGGYIARGTKVLKKLPIRVIDFDNEKDKILHDKISEVQKSLIDIQGKMDNSRLTQRMLIPLQRQFTNKKSALNELLKTLYNLEEDDRQIPLISELYATH
ncbi:Adenine-specific methyltransferase activity Eco57IA [Tenacibaculum maritimum]|uniref:Eco57I restriction-modification methylase domain-containing protein n=1 Tax=Tenacibaculum maritimum TaxID=107401 RepID=UPI0012E43096|nr:N-6 DNA methylase [Tenacibaculum maritimum]CAA0214282.1 Adenine-specific methyltransferase activity Eco57IA [Tenacibaculum maritimum]